MAGKRSAWRMTSSSQIVSPFTVPTRIRPSSALTIWAVRKKDGASNEVDELTGENTVAHTYTLLFMTFRLHQSQADRQFSEQNPNSSNSEKTMTDAFSVSEANAQEQACTWH